MNFFIYKVKFKFASESGLKWLRMRLTACTTPELRGALGSPQTPGQKIGFATGVSVKMIIGHFHPCISLYLLTQIQPTCFLFCCSDSPMDLLLNDAFRLHKI